MAQQRGARRANSGPLLAAALLPLLSLLAGAAAQGPLEYRRELSSGNSSIDAARSSVVGVNTVRFTLAPCTGLSPHFHNGSELLQPIQGSVRFGYVATNGTLVQAAVAIGQLYELPAAQMHYILNPNCQPAVFIGVFPLGTTTQFALTALAAIGPALKEYYASGPPPAPHALPFSTSAECTQQCQQGVVYVDPTAVAPPAAAQGAAGSPAPAPAG